jgi:hypothetical protein
MLYSFLQKKQIGKTVRDLCLAEQNEKAGTSTMGGWLIAVSVLIPVLLLTKLNNIYIILMIMVQNVKRLLIAILFILFPNFIYAQIVSDIDSVGNVWIFTTDKSGSMLKSSGTTKIADDVCRRLTNNANLDKIDYTKDRFLFFCSGYMPDYYIGEGNSIATDTRFDSCFIHHTDKQLHYMKDKSTLIAHIKDIISANDYKYKLSFVSQIRVFSLVKAIEFLKFQNENQNFNEVNIVTITDDADQNDQWMMDYRNLKKIDKSMKEKNKTEINGKLVRNKIEEISKKNARYIYTELNSKGFGKLDEIFSDEDNSPHIWIYKYATKQSQPINVTLNLLDVLANDGKQVVLTPLSSFYISDSICFYHIDSIKINNTIHKINQQFSEQWQGNMNYENGLHYNDIALYGSFQILYTDSIYGEHYKKIHFTQQAELPSAFLITTISTITIILAVLLAVFLIYWLLILPNKKLFVFYDNQGRKFVVKRGWKCQWQSGIIPVLSYIFDNKSSEVIHKKSTRIKQKTHDLGCADEDEFLIVSRYKITVPSAVLLTESNTKQDIEHFYINQSHKYKRLFENVYKKTPQYTVREHLRETSSEKRQRLWKILLFVLNIFAQKRYYLVKKPGDNNSNIRFTFSKWKNKTFVVEIANKTSNNLSSVFKKLNIQCMNDYYENRHSAKSIIGIYKDKSWIYWTVLQPEFAGDYQNSLKYAYNIFQFKQEYSNETENQITENLKVLKRTVKSQIGRGKKLIYNDYDSLTGVANKYNFEITETVCSGFLYLQEDNDAKDKTLIFSPFKDGLMTEKVVQVSKTAGSHLYLSFTIPSCLKSLDIDNTLWKKLSDTLFEYNHKDMKYLQIKDIAIGKQIILDPFSINIQ